MIVLGRKALKLFPKRKGVEEVTIPIPREKPIILTISFTNPKFASELAEKGVPLIEDSSEQETKKRSLIKKSQIALRSGVSPFPISTTDKGTIQATGVPLIIGDKISLSGVELLETLMRVADFFGLNAFLRIRKRTTEVGLTRKPRKGKPKITTKLYLIKPEKVRFPNKRGTKPVKTAELPTLLGKLLEAIWYVHAWNNPESLVISLTMRQPGKKPSHYPSIE